MVNRVVSVITVYNPNSRCFNNILKISEQSDLTIVLDNSKKKNESLIKSIKNIKYIFFGKNNGLSKAFNYILNDCNMEWMDDDIIVFWDQDTKIIDQHIDTLLMEYERLEHVDNKLGCLGPIHYDLNNDIIDIPNELANSKEDSIKVHAVITTSMMCKYKVLRSSGFWDERIFLDYADIAFCWKLHSKGYNVYITKKVMMYHRVGDRAQKVFFQKYYIGNPFREYYQCRDALNLIVIDYVTLRKKVALLLLLVNRLMSFSRMNDGKDRLSFFCRGLVHFFKRKKGSI